MEGIPIIQKKILGILTIILGLIFIAFPVFSSIFTSQVLGLSIIVFGIVSVFAGLNRELSAGYILVGILSVLFGLILTFNVLALPIIVALQFYIIAILMVFYAILALVEIRSPETIVAAILIIIFAIVVFLIGYITILDPVMAPILIGLALIVQGIQLAVINKYN